MSETTYAVFREQLAAERERVRGQLDDLGVHGTVAAYGDEGFADSGQVTAERGQVEALVGSLLDTLSDIDAALARFDNGTYGVCESCGGAISEARLEAMPAARRCITCASQRR